MGLSPRRKVVPFVEMGRMKQVGGGQGAGDASLGWSCPSLFRGVLGRQLTTSLELRGGAILVMKNRSFSQSKKHWTPAHRGGGARLCTVLLMLSSDEGQDPVHPRNS